MNLKKTIQRFNTKEFTDPYGIGSNFFGKISVFNEVTNSGEASRRRILETLPEVTVPASKVINGNGENFILGYPNKDEWRGSILRHKYPVLPVGNTSKISSIPQIITAAIPTTLYYGHPSFTREVSLELQDSDKINSFSFFFPSNTSITTGNVIIHGSTNYYKVRDVPYVDNAGFLVADVILLDSPVQTLTFKSEGNYDPITDTIAVASTQSITCFVEEAYLAYTHTSERYQKIEPGDKVITIKPSVTPKAGDNIGDYDILSIEANETAFTCHCRK